MKFSNEEDRAEAIVKLSKQGHTFRSMAPIVGLSHGHCAKIARANGVSGVRRGNRHYLSKLTEDDVRLIREADKERQRLLAEASHLTQGALAEKFDVSRSAIQMIASGERWGHVL